MVAFLLRLSIHCIRSKMTHVGYLAVGALPCNSHVNYVTLKHLQILLFKYKAIDIFIYPHADCLKSTLLNAENSQYTL